MSDQPMTVRRLFFEQLGAAAETAGQLAAEGDLDRLEEELAEQIKEGAWKLVREEIVEQIGAVLDFDIVGKVLTPAWSRLEALQEYRDPELHPPQESSLVPLVEHTVTSSHRPHIELLAGKTEIGRLDLEVELELEVEGAHLRIQGGRILAVRAGAATGSGKLVCSYQGTQVYELESEPRRFELEAEQELGDGVEIPDLEALG